MRPILVFLCPPSYTHIVSQCPCIYTIPNKGLFPTYTWPWLLLIRPTSKILLDTFSMVKSKWDHCRKIPYCNLVTWCVKVGENAKHIKCYFSSDSVLGLWPSRHSKFLTLKYFQFPQLLWFLFPLQYPEI